MSNTYFDHRGSAQRIPHRTMAQSTDVNNLFDEVSIGFDKSQIKDAASLHAPDGEAPANIPTAAARANKTLAFDANGDPIVVVAANTVEMQAAVAAAAAADIDATSAAADAAALAGSTNALRLLQIQTGVL